MHLKTRNVNTAFRELVTLFANESVQKGIVSKRSSRQGNVLVIDEPVTITYTHPRERVLFNQARDVNPFFLLYEQLWMLAGRNDVAPLAYYNSKIAEIASDDGVTFNGAYGYRWRKASPSTYGWKPDEYGREYWAETKTDQFDLLVDHLRNNPNSRRAVLQMWNVEDDLLKIGQPYPGDDVKYPNGKWVDDPSKDVCCNLSVMFSIRGKRSVKDSGGTTPWGEPINIEVGERYLDITVTNRSNDLVWGLLGSDYVTFTILQEYMAARLGCEVGVYHHFTSNLHVYDWNWKPEEWLKSEQTTWDKPSDEEGCRLSDCFYPYGTRNFVPLVKDPAVFERELPVIINAFSNSTGGSYTTSTEPFLDDVAKPMFQAFRYHKTNNPICALEECKFIKADDWRIAATNWLTKRNKK